MIAAMDEYHCSKGHPARLSFRFVRQREPEVRCLRHTLGYRPLVRTALVTAAVIGTVLTAINQGNILLDGKFPAELYWKIPLTYSVPYMVATWSAMRMAFVR
ncbi:MAG: hypothetical protein Kow0010_05370 [Dehalococcoidia bacterium]